MPADAVAFYAELFRKTTRTETWQNYLKDNQVQDAFRSPEETKKFLVDLQDRLRGLLTAAGVNQPPSCPHRRYAPSPCRLQRAIQYAVSLLCVLT